MAATRKSGVYLAIIGALVAVIAVMTYKLLLAGKTEAAPDGRVVLARSCHRAPRHASSWARAGTMRSPTSVV